MALKILSGIDVAGSMSITATDVPNLSASKITSGTFATSHIPNLDASKITSGKISASRMPDLSGTYLTSVPSSYITRATSDGLYQAAGDYADASHNHNNSYLQNSYTDVNMDTYDGDKSLLLGRNISGWTSGTKPSGSHNGFGILHVTTHSGGYATQFGFDTNQNKIWVRSRNPTSFGAWKYMWTEQDFTSTNVAYWNTAHGWGNHAVAGYLKTVPSEYLTQGESDGLYAPISHTHNYDNYGSWNLKTNSIQRTTVSSGGTLDLVAGSNVSLSYGAGGKVTISSTDTNTNTTYSAGTGLTLSGTTFSVTGNTYDSYGSAGTVNTRIDNEVLPLFADKLDRSVNPIKAATVSNDTITFTRADNTTFTVTTSDANTWRGIDDVPVNGQTAESISSNWAYDHANATNPHGITPATIGAQPAGSYLTSLPAHTHPISDVDGLQGALDAKQPAGSYQAAGTYNTVIGTDADIVTSGATIVDDIYMTDGVITSHSTRTLTPANIGAQPAGTYNTIIGTDSDINTSGSTIIDNIYVTDGVITSMGTRTLTAADLGISRPAPPEALTASVVGSTIDVVFNDSPSSPDNYLIFSSVNGAGYGLISLLSPEDMSATMSVIDSTFASSGTISYRVYAVKHGIYSAPATTSVTFAQPTEEIASLTSIALNTAHFVQWEAPAIYSRLVASYEVYMDAQNGSAELNRANAVNIYSGLNTSYMYAVSGADFDKYHQFWVEVTYR